MQVEATDSVDSVVSELARLTAAEASASHCLLLLVVLGGQFRSRYPVATTLDLPRIVLEDPGDFQSRWRWAEFIRLGSACLVSAVTPSAEGSTAWVAGLREKATVILVNGTGNHSLESRATLKLEQKQVSDLEFPSVFVVRTST